MRFWQRGDESGAPNESGAPGAPTGQAVDRLNDLADEVALKQGPITPEAAAAALRAVEAAERLLEIDAGLANQRRMARALWRQLSTFTMPAESDRVENTALRCWSICIELMTTAHGDAGLFDDVVGDVVLWVGSLVPALGLAGRHTDAQQVLMGASVASKQAVGARGTQARARMMIFTLAGFADTAAEQRILGRWGEADQQELAYAITTCREVISVLNEHLHDGAFEVSEVARTLQVLSRLQTIGGELREAATSLDEAVSLLSMVADEGPRYAEMLRGLEAERDGLRGERPRGGTPQAAPAPRPAPSAGVPREAFLRAARDVGIGADYLPETESGAARALDRIRAAEAEDPGRYGPARGLLLAWQARLLDQSGASDSARELADRAVRHLGLYSDRPQQIQASLVVALAVLRRAASACDEAEQATRAGQRAAVLFDALLARDATYANDLANVF